MCVLSVYFIKNKGSASNKYICNEYSEVPIKWGGEFDLSWVISRSKCTLFCLKRTKRSQNIPFRQMYFI